MSDGKPRFDQLTAQADTALQIGDYNKAEQLLKEALVEAQAFGENDPRVAATLVNLGIALQNLEKFQEAEDVLKRVINLARTVFGYDHLEVAKAMNNLAGLYYEQSQYQKAEPLCQQILTIYERTLGRDHLDVAMIATNLAMLYHNQKDYSRAEPLYQRALSIRQKALGFGHPDVINILENYASLLDATGRQEEAEYMRASVMGRVSGTMRSTITNIPAIKPPL